VRLSCGGKTDKSPHISVHPNKTKFDPRSPSDMSSDQQKPISRIPFEGGDCTDISVGGNEMSMYILPM